MVLLVLKPAARLFPSFPNLRQEGASAIASQNQPAMAGSALPTTSVTMALYRRPTVLRTSSTSMVALLGTELSNDWNCRFRPGKVWFPTTNSNGTLTVSAEWFAVWAQAILAKSDSTHRTTKEMTLLFFHGILPPKFSATFPRLLPVDLKARRPAMASIYKRVRNRTIGSWARTFF